MNTLSNPMIQLKNLQHRYTQGQDEIVLQYPDLILGSTDNLAICGVSGSGKSTLLHFIAGNVVPSTGEVWVANTAVHLLNEAQRDRFRAQNIGFVYQDFYLLDGFSALDNVLAALKIAGYPAKNIESKAREVLQLVGLGHRLQHTPKQLSTGERQRVAIARAIAHRPKVLLADEPTAHLDPKRAEQVMNLFSELTQAQAMTFITVSHDPVVLTRFTQVIDIQHSREAQT